MNSPKTHFFELPNLPNKRSKGVVLDCRAGDETREALEKLGIFVIPSYKSEQLSEPVCTHPDMTILHLGSSRFVCSADSYDYYKDAVSGAEIIKSDINLKYSYPFDISFNITILNDTIFMNSASEQFKIYKSYIDTNKKILNVKQGYTKCSICIVSSDAIITSDTGIHKAAIKNKFNSLLIQPGFIKLPGMNYGFIGGASGLIASDMLAINGDVKTHPDGDRIIDFCMQHGVNVISLKKGEIYDIGSILPIF